MQRLPTQARQFPDRRNRQTGASQQLPGLQDHILRNLCPRLNKFRTFRTRVHAGTSVTISFVFDHRSLVRIKRSIHGTAQLSAVVLKAKFAAMGTESLLLTGLQTNDKDAVLSAHDHRTVAGP